MATLIDVIVETGEHSSVWEVLRRHGIVPADEGESDPSSLPEFLLVRCTPSLGNLGVPQFAEELSRELGTMVLAMALQTAASVAEIVHYDAGVVMRRLQYSGEEGSLVCDGEVQQWEPAVFFDPEGSATDDERPWPDTLWDELSDEDLQRYEEAREQGRVSEVMDILHLESMSSVIRAHEFFGLRHDKPHGRYAPPSKWRWWQSLLKR